MLFVNLNNIVVLLLRTNTWLQTGQAFSEAPFSAQLAKTTLPTRGPALPQALRMLILFTLSLILPWQSYANANGPLRGAIPIITAGPDFPDLFRRQVEICPAGASLCPNQIGCCPIGEVCTTNTNGVPFCMGVCVGAADYCTGVASGLCCDGGSVCDTATPGLCIPTGGATSHMGVGPVTVATSVTSGFGASHASALTSFGLPTETSTTTSAVFGLSSSAVFGLSSSQSTSSTTSTDSTTSTRSTRSTQSTSAAEATSSSAQSSSSGGTSAATAVAPFNFAGLVCLAGMMTAFA